MLKYPVFLKLSGRRVVVIGGGDVASRKVRALLATGAKIIVIAEQLCQDLTEACRGTDTKLIESSYSKNHLAEATLVVTATDNNQINKQVYSDCRDLGILCNVVDVPELCDFFVPAVVKRGNLQIAISTDGCCPAYAAHLRRKLEKDFTEKHGEFMVELENARQKIIKEIPEIAKRKKILERLVKDESFECFKNDGAEKWREFAAAIIFEESKKAE